MFRSIVTSVNKQSIICIKPNFSSCCNNMLLKSFSTNPSVDTRIENSEKRIRHTKDKGIVFPNNFNIFEAVKVLKKYNWAKFNETIEIAVNLGVDPRKPNQSIKGIAKLPQGTGKIVRVAVFAKGADADAARTAGAEIVGADDLLAKVQAGEINFDTLISTPEMMPLIGKIGKILGPRGLMPNPKMGTVTKDVAKAIKAAKTGAVQFRVEKKGIIQAGIGKMNFTEEAILENVRSFMVAVTDSKPEGLKGKYILAVHLSSTMGPGIPVDVPSVDPSNGRFFVDPSLVKNV